MVFPQPWVRVATLKAGDEPKLNVSQSIPSSSNAPVMYPLLPHLLGWVGIMTFQSPGINPALWGQADGNNLALSRVRLLTGVGRNAPEWTCITGTDLKNHPKIHALSVLDENF